MTVTKFQHIDLLNGLPEEELEALNSILSEHKAKKGETIIRAADESDSMMFLLNGKLRVSLSSSDGKEIVLSHLDKGQFVGEISLLTGEDRSADVTAIEDSTLLVLSREHYLEHTGKFAGLSQALASELALNSVSAVVGPSGGNEGWAYRASEKGVTPNKTFRSPTREGRIYRLEVSGMNLPRYPKVRRISKELLVPYEKLSDTLQQINKMGGKVASITLA